MSDTKLPLLHKAPVEGLAIHVGRSGLAIGDTARLERLSDGRIGVFAHLRKTVLGFFPRWQEGFLGHLEPLASEIVTPSLDHGDPLRVRIVALMPEHLSNGYPPEVHISVWGDPRHINPVLAALDLPPGPMPETTRPQPTNRRPV